MDDVSEKSLLHPGQNCWRIETAERAAILLSGERYFRAFRQALLLARKQVIILAWDLHSEILLERGPGAADDGLPQKLGPFLNALLEQRPELEIHLLIWDFSVIYAAEREWRMFSESLANPHPRLHLHFDDQLPLGVSHHQKVVVVDDALAFAGGIDLSQWRWDRPHHPYHEEFRVDASGKPYQPFHDIQMAVTGPAAVALADLCAERWERATGERLQRPQPASPAPWPEELEEAFEQVEVGIARTYSAFEPWPAIHEAERLHLDLIARARNYIYIENQYFSSRRISDAIAGRLRDPDGPEVILIITQSPGGWLEESTMGLVRNRLFEMLHDADEHQRLRLYYPRVTDEESGQSNQVYVHAKLLIVDDQFLKIGSSNISNRSMRMDSEVDLVVTLKSPGAEVRRWLHELLAVHYHVPVEQVARHLESYPNLRAALDEMPSVESHTLAAFEARCKSDLERQLADTELLDPEEPPDPDYWIRNLIPKPERGKVLKRLTKVTLLLATGLLLAFLLKEGWSGVVTKEAMIGHLESIQSNPWAPGLVLLLFAGGSTVGVPLNLLLISATLVMGPWMALGCGYVGAYLSSLAGYGLGHTFGRKPLEKWVGKYTRRLERQLRKRGTLAVIIMRILPVAPFFIINLSAGALKLSLRSFNLGTLVGMLPGMSAVVLLTHQMGAAVDRPEWDTIAGFLATFAAVGGAIYFIRRALAARRAAPAAS